MHLKLQVWTYDHHFDVMRISVALTGHRPCPVSAADEAGTARVRATIPSREDCHKAPTSLPQRT